MRKLIITIVFVLTSQGVFAGPDFKEGLWEITSKMDMPNMPMTVPATTIKQCLTQANMVPDTSGQNNCSVDHQVSGNTVSWTVSCQTEQGEMTGQGKMTYADESFDGKFVMNMPNSPMGAMQMTTKMNGRYIGSCQ